MTNVIHASVNAIFYGIFVHKIRALRALVTTNEIDFAQQLQSTILLDFHLSDSMESIKIHLFK